MLVLSARNVVLDYVTRLSFFKTSRKRVFNDLSLDLYQGECLGVIGRNGVGKSTLLKLLAGIIEPNEGEIFRATDSIALLSLGVGFDPELSGRYNVILNGMMMGMTRRQMLESLPLIVEFSELGDALDLPLKTYSAGMRARLGFSTAITLNPDVLLMDELLAVGDLQFKQKSHAAMRQKLESDQTVVLVSHQGKTIKRWCERAVWLENGTTMMSGKSDEVVDAYQEFVKKARQKGK